MDYLSPFLYEDKRTILHRSDTRVKLAGIVVSAFFTFYTGVIGLCTLTVLLLFGFFLGRISINHLLMRLTPFFVFLTGVILISAVSYRSPDVPNGQFLDRFLDGLVWGGILAWRLMIFFLFSVLLISTTSIVDLRKALVWVLRPIPFLPERKVGLMMSLTIGMLPSLAIQAQIIGEAQRARGIDSVRNPFIRIKHVAFPLLILAFRHADEVAQAMEARCYRGE